MSVQDISLYYRDLAFKVLIEISEIKCCEYHNDYYYRLHSYDEAEIYARSTKRVQEIVKNDNTIDYNMYHAAIKHILDESGVSSSCPICESNITKLLSE